LKGWAYEDIQSINRSSHSFGTGAGEGLFPPDISADWQEVAGRGKDPFT
jgi:hypothetical protein